LSPKPVLADADRVLNFCAFLREPAFSTPAIILQSFLANRLLLSNQSSTTAYGVHRRQTLKTQVAPNRCFQSHLGIFCGQAIV
jgi:hypothetical protein